MNSLICCEKDKSAPCHGGMSEVVGVGDEDVYGKMGQAAAKRINT